MKVFKTQIMDKHPKNQIKKEFTGGSPGHVKNAKYFYFDNIRQNNKNLTILCGGHEQCEPDFEISRTKFPFFGIIYIINGKGVFTLNSKSYVLRPGTIFAFSPDEPYKYTTDVQDAMEQIFVIFVGEYAKKLLKTSTLTDNPVITVSNPQATMVVLEQILENGFNQNEYAQKICCNYLTSILLELSNTKHFLQSDKTSFDSFQKCKHYLENNFTSINSSTQLAKQCCLDRRYIARLFKKYEHKKPYEYLMQLKMNKAANLLITTKLNVNQIARMTGIEDAYHFSKIFKRRFGISPSGYRLNPKGHI